MSAPEPEGRNRSYFRRQRLRLERDGQIRIISDPVRPTVRPVTLATRCDELSPGAQLSVELQCQVEEGICWFGAGTDQRLLAPGYVDYHGDHGDLHQVRVAVTLTGQQGDEAEFDVLGGVGSKGDS
jgi:hypothetical protein